MKTWFSVAAVLACLGLVGAACGSGGDAASGTKLDVLASFYPLQYVAERIAGAHATVGNLVPPGAEPHDVELSPRDVAHVGEADLIVYLSGLQPAVDEAVRVEAADSGFDVAPHARLLPAEDLAGEGGEEGHEAPEENGEEHNHGTLDPHFWLDPTRLADVADAVAGKLTELDPEGADDYTAAAAALRDDLAVLDGDFAAALEGCANTDLVTSHSAFGYLAQRYGLTQVGIGGLSPETEPNTQQIARVSAFVREHEVAAIYYETLVSPDVAEVIATETGAQTAVLDPLEGLTDTSAGDDYLEIMRANLDTLVTHQPCLR